MADPNPRKADALAAQAAAHRERGSAPLSGAAGKPAWMARYRVPSQVSGPEDADMSRNLIGATIVLYSVEPGVSRRHDARFTRWSYQTIDTDTGELLHEPARLVSFAQPIVRFADALNGGELTGLVVLNPPVVVRVEQEGDVVLFRDPT